MAQVIEIAGHDAAIPCEDGESILDAIERAGFSVPYSCRKGVCATCECTLVSGSVSIGRKRVQAEPQETVRVCVATPRSSIVLAPSSIRKADLQQRKRFTATVYRLEQRAADVTVVHLRLPIGRRLPFRSGQFVRVHFGPGESRNYSLANASRANDQIVLHIRHVPGGRFSEGHLQTLRHGDSLDIEGPFGQFGSSEGSVAPIVMLATGTGYAPFKSMLENRQPRAQPRPMHLFWGGRRSEDLYERELLAEMARRESWFRFTPVLTSPETDWSGSRGFVQSAALETYRDFSEVEVLACGNPRMVNDAKALLLADGNLSEGSFFADAFLPSASDAT